LADEPESTPEVTEPAAADAAPEPEAAAPEPEPEPDPDPVCAEVLARLQAVIGDAIIEHAESFGTLIVRVQPDSWRRAAESAKHDLDCDYLSFIAGIDWQPAAKVESDGNDTSTPAQPTEQTPGVAGGTSRFQVFAHAQSTTRHWGVTFKADVDDDSPHLASWVPVYAGADWHERECWEMFGIVFDGHPSLRHLYLPAEFEGHPLRKDYPLLARDVKPWPGLVDVEPMPGEDEPVAAAAGEGEA
jgi:NADH-quinone oxidoreductase subunit C